MPLFNPPPVIHRKKYESVGKFQQLLTPLYSKPPVIVWFRDDQRLADNPALEYAIATGHPIVCVYIYDPAPNKTRLHGEATRWWLVQSLYALNTALVALGGELTILYGTEWQSIEAFAVVVGAIKVCWNRRYSTAQRELDSAIKMALKKHGIAVFTFNGHLLREPWTVAMKNGRPFRVFSAYWRAARHAYSPESPRPRPQKINFFPIPGYVSKVVRICHLSTIETQAYMPNVGGRLLETWECGEQAGWVKLNEFLTHTLSQYAFGRDFPAMKVTSRLSPYLRFGNLSVRQVWHALLSTTSSMSTASSIDKFLYELGWREFSYYLLYYYPPLHQVNLKQQFDDMPWRHSITDLHAWQSGNTGYPLVDASMRELWHTGWMHNRVRMVTASFLVKHLLIHWREGETWFWDKLVDADEASNPANWQWVAGSGADAVPYFRIFNPVLQSKKFDSQATYVRRWIPELARLSNACIHAPWLAQPAQLASASVRLGQDYPLPIVPHQQARNRALQAIKRIREYKSGSLGSLLSSD
ncbi:cryptochrome/photolyase family protein [Candidatus Vallotia lariciata]|uniref:cryptochrome/photolyase family protein n=1 Tax=Candidatus Vallotia laricis TaxID=2018052 RepID=UPI001D011794|nr:deoxyribodipyrimidine photo-lyase [Candidatus Vallotia lariciata]UDG83018.1 Deoxyribodipyrimidine photo-lyase [Candidatus Vallotia lariciata]